ncbi:MAG: NTP transferase domain-containing protein [Bacteroides sp.]|nr:NTP transferase domain-containing protein [Bacteroides sp.]MBD5348401.1 NTP transferase domain-containing protein [Bacteroides sp.]
MQIILLSGGSGTRLWPLSNDARSKQFLRLLDVGGTGRRESMVQRVMRQLRESGITADVTVATSASQRDSVLAQLGPQVNIVTEPTRRDTFPAICLACEFLAREKNCAPDETIIVMPCDPYTEAGYFEAINKMAGGLENSGDELIVMGIDPTYPSAKYGYIVPAGGTASPNGVIPVKRFTEKPDVEQAKKLISEGALWNGGVFAFKLDYVTRIAEKYVKAENFAEIRDRYEEFPKISFDYEVAEKASKIGMVKYHGDWKDLGTWNTLTDELKTHEYGNVTTDGTGRNTHIFNELQIPLLCLGTQDLVIAASPDGIIVSEKNKSENVKTFAATLKQRPMFEERRWGSYKVIDSIEFPDGYCALTKQLTVNADCALSYQRHFCRDEVWTLIDGKGEVVIDDVRRPVQRGETIFIPKGVKHALRAFTSLTFIEVQSGSNLIEEDIERFDYKW